MAQTPIDFERKHVADHPTQKNFTESPLRACISRWPPFFAVNPWCKNDRPKLSPIRPKRGRHWHQKNPQNNPPAKEVKNTVLVGGWTNPIWNILGKMGSSSPPADPSGPGRSNMTHESAKAKREHQGFESHRLLLIYICIYIYVYIIYIYICVCFFWAICTYTPGTPNNQFEVWIFGDFQPSLMMWSHPTETNYKEMDVTASRYILLYGCGTPKTPENDHF